jgi:hypothetical protein
MSGKQVGGIVCLVLAAALLISGINSIMGRADLADPSGVGASFVVGAILPSVLALIVGLVLFRRPS